MCRPHKRAHEEDATEGSQDAGQLKVRGRATRLRLGAKASDQRPSTAAVSAL